MFNVFSERRSAGASGVASPGRTAVTRPRRPADVSALPRAVTQRARTTSGRQCARSESFARLPTHTRTLAAAQKFYHPPPPPRGRSAAAAEALALYIAYAATVGGCGGGDGAVGVEGAKVSKRFFIEQNRSPPPNLTSSAPHPPRVHTHTHTSRAHTHADPTATVSRDPRQFFSF